MNYTFNNDVPIYLQIVDLVTNDISSGKLVPGQKIPSVREYAIYFKVNPNTICKALSILEERKLVYTERTNGKYVSNDLSLISIYKEKIFKEKIDSFLKDLYNMGYTKENIIKKIEEAK